LFSADRLGEISMRTLALSMATLVFTVLPAAAQSAIKCMIALVFYLTENPNRVAQAASLDEPLNSGGGVGLVLPALSPYAQCPCLGIPLCALIERPTQSRQKGMDIDPGYEHHPVSTRVP